MVNNPMGFNQYTAPGGCFTVAVAFIIISSAVLVTGVGNAYLNIFAGIIVIPLFILGVFFLFSRLSEGGSLFVTILLIMLLLPFGISVYNIIVTPGVFIKNSAITPGLSVEQLQGNITRNTEVEYNGVSIPIMFDNVTNLTITGYSDSSSGLGIVRDYDHRTYSFSFAVYNIDDGNNIT